MRSRRQPAVPTVLVEQIDDALAAVDETRAELVRIEAAHAPLAARRKAHANVEHAFDEADALLRQAATMAKQRSYQDWALWRHRLSRLDNARQIHLLAEQDECSLLPLGAIRAIDTGMTGPDIGDLLHGESRDPGTPPTYGLDLEALLSTTSDLRSPTAPPHRAA